MPANHVDGRCEPCQICRARKVKCDRRPGGCANCQRLDFSCSYSTSRESEKHALPGSIVHRDPDALDEYTLAGTQRKRSRRACRQCYLQKSRCSGEVPCSRCRAHGRDCIYTPKAPFKNLSHSSARFLEKDAPSTERRGDESNQDPNESWSLAQNQDVGYSSLPPSQLPSPPQLHGVESSSEQILCTLGLEKYVISQYIDAFFELVQPNLCFFIHRAAFISKWNNGTLDICHLKAVCGCAAHFSGASTDTGSPVSAFMLEVEREVLGNVETINILHLQHTFLLVYYKYVLHQLSSVWMLFSLCVRSAYAQGLNHENSSISVFEQESRRRLMWAIFILDKLTSGSLPDLTLCTTKSIHLRLPCNERCFTYGISSKTQYLDDDDSSNIQDMGLHAYIVKLIDLRQRIHSCIKPIIAEGSSPWYHKEDVSALEQELLAFTEILPDELKWSKENLELRSYSPSLTNYVILHSWWYSTQCDLYRCFVPGIRESVSDEAARITPVEYISAFRQKSLDSAIKHTRLWAMVQDLQIKHPILFYSQEVIRQQRLSNACSAFELLGPGLALVGDLSIFYPMLKDINKDIIDNFAGRNQDPHTAHHQFLPGSEKVLRNRVLSKYAMVPSLPEDVAYSSRQGSEKMALLTAQPSLERVEVSGFTGMEILGPIPDGHTTPLLKPRAEQDTTAVESQQIQEWAPSLLGEPASISNDLMTSGDLSWVESPDLVFFPGFYQGQIDPYDRISST